MNHSDAGKKGYAKTQKAIEAHRERQKSEARSRYEENPKVCPTCDKPLPYEKRYNNFCNQSCAASYNNRGVLRVPTTNPKECAECGKPKEKRHNKYCDNCIKNNVYSNKITEFEAATIDRTRKRILIELRGHQCENCNLSTWLEQPIPLELHHLDGNADNHSQENLMLICPNCHALTENYKGANMGIDSSRQKMRRIRYKNGKTY
jgi:hypothetical protein